MYVCTSYVYSALVGQQTVSGPLKSELKMAVSLSMWVLESRPGPVDEQPMLINC